MCEALKCLFPWDLLAMLLGTALLTWWLTRNAFNGTLNQLRDRVDFLEGELDTCRQSKSSGSTSANVSAGAAASVSADAGTGTAGLAANAGVAAASFAAGAATTGAGVTAAATGSGKKDDLKIVEGIGPKIEELFHNGGIFTFAQLADSSVETMKAILEAAGPRFQMHDPSTWAAQAALARDGKWDELKQWQDELNKGKKA